MADLETYIELLIAKDEAAFEAVYHQTKHSVYAMIVSMVKDRSAAEDLMQDTYIKMIASIRQYDPKRNFTTWLLTIARNLAIDELRKRKREQPVDPMESENIFPKTEAKGETDLLVEEYLMRLDEDERQVFLLHIVDNMKHREIAKIVDKPLGTVLWLYQKALRKIKK